MSNENRVYKVIKVLTICETLQGTSIRFRLGDVDLSAMITNIRIDVDHVCNIQKNESFKFKEFVNQGANVCIYIVIENITADNTGQCK